MKAGENFKIFVCLGADSNITLSPPPYINLKNVPPASVIPVGHLGGGPLSKFPLVFFFLCEFFPLFGLFLGCGQA